MSRYKRLNHFHVLRIWFSKFGSKEYQPEFIEPIFNKNGAYYDRHFDICWEEYNGHACLLDKEVFLSDLLLLNTPVLTETELKAMKFLDDRNLLQEEQKIIIRNNNIIKYGYRGCKEV